MYYIFKASDELKQDLNNFINNKGTVPYSNSLSIHSNSAYEICLIVYEFLINLEKDSYGLVTSCGAGFHTLHLYKLSDDQIVLVHSGINGVINKVETTDDSFISKLRETLNIFKIDWNDYEENKLKIKNKIIHPECIIPEVCIGQ